VLSALHYWLPVHGLKIDEQYINRSAVKIPTTEGASKMQIDINIKAHDLLWHSMSLGLKKAYRESYGVARDELVDKEVQRLTEAGYVEKSDKGIELTSAGKELHRKMTTVCKKSE
jgi:coproporphyrinogen III oxidase-like Fe-S oxidoreductase